MAIATSAKRASPLLSILAAVLPITITGTPITVQPGMVQGMVDYMRMNDVDAGFVASAEMAGLMLATVLFAFVSDRINWRKAYALGLVLVVTANVGSVLLAAGAPFTALRTIAGAGAGVVAAIGFATLGETENAPRNYGWAVATIIGYSGVALRVMPALFAIGGYHAFLLMYALLTAACLPLVPFLSHKKGVGGEISETVASEKAGITPVGILAIASMFIFFTGYAAAWTYMALIGRDLGLNESAVAHALSLSQFAGVAGALAIVIQSGKVHDMVQAGAILAGGALAILAFTLPQDYAMFLALNCIFQFCWNAGQPLLLGIVASRDSGGRLLSFTIPMQYIGLTAGPAFAASQLGSQSNYQAVMLGAGVIAAIALVAIAPLILTRKPKSRNGTA